MQSLCLIKLGWVLLVGLLFFSTCKRNTPTTEKESVSEIIPITSKDTFIDVKEIQSDFVPDYDTMKWTDLAILSPNIVQDLRYATDNNFVEEAMYECGRCFLRPKAAKALAEVQKDLKKIGLGLKVFDCYRPRPIQWKLWNKVPNPKYVADPRKGSMHNRGVAVDLTIVDAQGNQLDMGTQYDYFGVEAHTNYTQLPDVVLQNRKLLQEVMKKHGYSPIRSEWWHFSMRKSSFPLDDFLWKCN